MPTGIDSGARGLLHWTPEAPERERLYGRGVHVLEWESWRTHAQRWLRPDDPERTTLKPPADAPLRELRSKPAVAVLKVRLSSITDVRDLYGGLLVPLLRASVPLLVECPTAPEELDAARFVEPGFEHAFTVERLRWLCLQARERDVGYARPTTPRDLGDLARLDDSQRRAVQAVVAQPAAEVLVQRRLDPDGALPRQ